ncbi:hypothetical protein [Bordetella genomosp. 13]|uniref:hypothetical protein n=1 Tax=Bordetella genomosp. 13 TaxID=463040 RepID=UPI0011A19794|nr:hypothetical protein [Bordetella genomosp. 13]
MRASSQHVRIDEAPMTDEDITWLRQNTRHKTVNAVVGTVFFLFFLAATAVLAWMRFTVSMGPTPDTVLTISIVLLTLLVLFFARHLLRMPRSWRRLRRAVRGHIPKHVASGLLTGFGASRAGVRYMFGEECLDAVLPIMNMNDISVEGSTAVRPVFHAARIGTPVRLHLLELWPGRPAILLRAEYEGSEPARQSCEPISQKDRQQVRADEVAIRNIFLGMALVMAALGLFVWPVLICAGVLVVLGLVLGRPSRRLKKADFKFSVRGQVDEALTYRMTAPPNMTPIIVHAYRVGGLLYTVGHGGDAAQPGERVAFEYLEGRGQARQPLFFHREGSARTAIARQTLGGPGTGL